MKTRNLLDCLKFIIFSCFALFISSCATNKQYGSPSELLGTWFYEFEDSEGHYIEQTYTFNSDGKCTVETREFTTVVFRGEKIRVVRPQDIKFFYFLLSSKGRKTIMIMNDQQGLFPYKIENGYLIILAISNNRFDQSIAKYRKLSDTEVQNWINADGKPLSEM